MQSIVSKLAPLCACSCCHEYLYSFSPIIMQELVKFSCASIRSMETVIGRMGSSQPQRWPEWVSETIGSARKRSWWDSQSKLESCETPLGHRSTPKNDIFYDSKATLGGPREVAHKWRRRCFLWDIFIFWGILGSQSVGPWKSCLSHYWVTLIVLRFLGVRRSQLKSWFQKQADCTEEPTSKLLSMTSRCRWCAPAVVPCCLVRGLIHYLTLLQQVLENRGPRILACCFSLTHQPKHYTLKYFPENFGLLPSEIPLHNELQIKKEAVEMVQCSIWWRRQE